MTESLSSERYSHQLSGLLYCRSDWHTCVVSASHTWLKLRHHLSKASAQRSTRCRATMHTNWSADIARSLLNITFIVSHAVLYIAAVHYLWLLLTVVFIIASLLSTAFRSLILMEMCEHQRVSELRLSIPLETLAILGTIFTDQMTQPTVSERWKKPVGRQDQTLLPLGPLHQSSVLQ